MLQAVRDNNTERVTSHAHEVVHVLGAEVRTLRIMLREVDYVLGDAVRMLYFARACN